MKTVIVTGGSRGIGAAIVKELALKKYNVVLNYNKSEKEAEKIKEELKENDINIEIFKADVSDKKQAKELIKFTLNKFKNIDVSVMNISKLEKLGRGEYFKPLNPIYIISCEKGRE